MAHPQRIDEGREPGPGRRGDADGVRPLRRDPEVVPAIGRLDDSFGATWRADLSAGVVVFLVALPLCLGVALASGAPLLSGVLTGIVGGVLVSRLSGSSLMVSGPAAGLTAIVFASIAQLGSFPAFLLAVMLAGALQLLLGIIRAGTIAYFFPSSVIRGMLAAIGLILILKQLPYAFGRGVEVFESDSFATPQGGNTFSAIRDAVLAPVPVAVLIAVVALALLLAWPKLAPAKVRKLVPGPLAAVLAAIGLHALVAALAPAMALPRAAFVNLPVAERISDLGGYLTMPDWGAITNPLVWKVAITIGIVASLETLLSLEATDKLDRYKRSSPTNRELLAQGAGNMVAGAIGGLPMTGVIVRSAANIEAGGRTWRSSFIHGVFLLGAVAAAPQLLNHIPLAALAAILIHTGFKLASPKVAMEAWRLGRRYAAAFVVTVVAILVTDLLVGIGIGVVVATMFLLHDSYRNACSYHLRESGDHRHVRITLAEEVTFLNKAAINKVLHEVPEGATVVIDGSRTRYMDPDVVDILNDFRDSARSRGITPHYEDVPRRRVAAAGH